MAKPWEANIKSTGKLTVFNGMSAGRWANIFALALRSFNRYSRQTGVTLERAGNIGAANVVMKLGDGAVSYDYQHGNQTVTKTIEGFNGTSLHGLTKTIAFGGEISKAHVFLPATPQTKGFDNRTKEFTKNVSVSQGAMEIIAVHELIHAAGLDEKSDHASDGIFYDLLQYEDGKMFVPEAGKNNRKMPPIYIDDATLGNLKALW